MYYPGGGYPASYFWPLGVPIPPIEGEPPPEYFCFDSELVRFVTADSDMTIKMCADGRLVTEMGLDLAVTRALDTCIEIDALVVRGVSVDGVVERGFDVVSPIVAKTTFTVEVER